MKHLQIKWKLLISYLGVIAVCILVAVLVTRQLTLSTYSDHLRQMADSGMGGMGGMMSSMTSDLDTAFRDALNDALLWGGLTAVAAAVAVSFFVSRRLTSPIHSMAEVTGRIAEGDFSRRVNETGDDELGTLAHSLNRMAESLDSSEQQRRELMANIAHELRTPLASISGYMEALADGVVPADRETYDLVHQEAGRLNRLVDDLQRLSRSESGEEQLDMVDTELGPFLENVARKLEPRFAEKGIELDIQVDERSGNVMADRDKLEQILINLLDNALGYTDQGGSVTITTILAENNIELRLSDTGSGIAAEDLPHIFERFYRADKSRSRESGGSGIGLTITKSYVEAMGGRISAKSTTGKGTTFTIILPKAK